jgi:hypothetical protein
LGVSTTSVKKAYTERIVSESSQKKKSLVPIHLSPAANLQGRHSPQSADIPPSTPTMTVIRPNGGLPSIDDEIIMKGGTGCVTRPVPRAGR